LELLEKNLEEEEEEKKTKERLEKNIWNFLRRI